MRTQLRAWLEGFAAGRAESRPIGDLAPGFPEDYAGDLRMMKWASALSTDEDLEDAVVAATNELRTQLGGTAPDFVAVFASEHDDAELESLGEMLAAELGPGLVVGCTAGGVIGAGEELEQEPGLSLTAAVLPGVGLHPFHLPGELVPGSGAPAEVWEEAIGIRAAADPQLLLLADPFSFDTEGFLRGLDATYPTASKVGGLASGGAEAGTNILYLGQEIYDRGLVGVAMSGNVEIDTIVAQGCKPIGLPMFVTRCEGNLLLELDGRQPREVLEELYQSLDSGDRALMRNALFIGLVMREACQSYQKGDFLVRNILGIDGDNGALAIGAQLHENLVVQFHLRDAQASAADLEEMLGRWDAGSAYARPQGSLLFSCLGRGERLYGHPNHDSDAFRRHVGDVPLGGFFCNGEIGAVHGSTFLHGYTSAFGLFRSRATA